MDNDKRADTEGQEANDAAAGADPYGNRFRQIDAATRGLHAAAIDGLNPGASSQVVSLAGATAVAHIINLAAFAVMALTEIAEAQQRVAAYVEQDFLNNNPPPVNPSDKIERKPLGGRRKPFTAPE